MKHPFLKTLCLLMLLYCSTPSLVNAQIYGYGSGYTASFTTSLSYGRVYTDDARGSVTNISGSGPACTVTLDPAHVYGTLSAGDMVVLIQMTHAITPGNVGIHQNAKVTGHPSTYVYTLSLEPVYPSGAASSLAAYSYTTDRVQMVQVPVASSFTLNPGGEVTCHPWDGYTGGVLALVVQGALVVTGGDFNAASMGYYHTVSGGLGGAGGAGKTTSDFLGNPGMSFACTSIGGSNTFVPVNPGFAGGGATNSGASGTVATASPIVYGAANAPTLLRMGNAGTFTTGRQGGQGASGGAAGGNGAASLCPIPGTAGLPGANGGNGGDVGLDGRGGGAMVIKANSINIANAFPVFLVDGQNGNAGGNGGLPGIGGVGGIGGMGCCSGGTPNPKGGDGGSGLGGATGGGGAAGGNGGFAGNAWVMAQSATSNVAAVHGSVSGGGAGPGGKGSYGFPTTPGGAAVGVVPNMCTMANCVPTPPVPCTTPRPWPVVDYVTCDIKEAMCALVNPTMSGAPASGNWEFNISTPSLPYIVKYDKTTSKFTYAVDDVANCQTIHYITELYAKTDCDYIFDIMSGTLPIPNSGGVLVNLNNSASNCPTVPTVVDFRTGVAQNSLPLIEYNSQNNYIELLFGNHPRCYAGGCDPRGTPSTPGSGQGSLGIPGVSTGGGTKSANQNPNANFNYGNGGSWKMDPETTGINEVAGNPMGISVYPNPSTDRVTIAFTAQSTQEAILKVYDIEGRLITQRSMAVVEGKNEQVLPVKQWAKGIYTVTITQGDIISRSKLQVE